MRPDAQGGDIRPHDPQEQGCEQNPESGCFFAQVRNVDICHNKQRERGCNGESRRQRL